MDNNSIVNVSTVIHFIEAHLTEKLDLDYVYSFIEWKNICHFIIFENIRLCNNRAFDTALVLERYGYMVSCSDS